jgi:DnaJ-class molecular chaperone
MPLPNPPLSPGPSEDTQPCFMCCGKGDVVSGEVGRPRIRPCSHCHGSGRLPKPYLPSDIQNPREERE